MDEIAGWIAPAATMIAAMMTAANLGARVTGWGFVVFLIGSVAWSAVALLTDQANLLWTNIFLTIVNIVGIWRWLGRKARLDDGAAAAVKESRAEAAPTLFPVALLDGGPIHGADGAVVAHSLGAMAECRSGRPSYLVVGEGGVAGVGERLHAVPWQAIRVDDERLVLAVSLETLRGFPEVEPRHWPPASPLAVGA